MTLIFSLIILGLSLYLFIVTHRKLENIKDEATDEVRQEMQALISEFNRTAVRNIEILEDKMNELQKILDKSDRKMIHLDNRIARAAKPIVIEKIVREETPPQKPKKNSTPQKSRTNPSRKKAPKSTKEKDIPVSKKKPTQPVQKVKPSPTTSKIQKTISEKPTQTNTSSKESVSPQTLSRSELLKQLISDGTPLEELLAKGFHENEINLLRFLIQKK